MNLMNLFKKNRNSYEDEETNGEIGDVKYVPYICDGEKWLRVYGEDELELIKKEAYEQGFKDGVTSCNENKEQKVVPPSGKFLPKAAKDGEVFLLEY